MKNQCKKAGELCRWVEWCPQHKGISGRLSGQDSDCRVLPQLHPLSTEGWSTTINGEQCLSPVHKPCLDGHQILFTKTNIIYKTLGVTTKSSFLIQLANSISTLPPLFPYHPAAAIGEVAAFVLYHRASVQGSGAKEPQERSAGAQHAYPTGSLQQFSL